MIRIIGNGRPMTLALRPPTAESRKAKASLRAFANGKGGRIVIGVKP
jgi:hypothetical protein